MIFEINGSERIKELFAGWQETMVWSCLQGVMGHLYADDLKYRIIQRRIEALHAIIPRKMSVYSTLITTYGVKKNEYSGIFVKMITFDDLFR